MNNNGQSKEKVNLLPEEMRGKEEKELEKVRKNPHLVEIEMTDPKGGFVFRNKEEAQGGPGFWRSLFKIKPPEAFDSIESPTGFDLEQKSVKEKSAAVETSDIAVKQIAKELSWWQRLFGASEEKERRRIEKLALIRAKQEAAYRQQEAAKRAKLENKMRQQREKQLLIEKKKQETEARQKMMKTSQLEKTERKEAEERRRQEKARAEVKKIEVPPIRPAFRPMPPPVPTPPPVPAPPPPKKPALPERPEKSEKDEEKIIRTEVPLRGKVAGLDVNLIPEELIKAKKLKLSRQLLNLSGVVLIVLAVIGGAYGWLMSYQTKMNNKIKAVDEQINQINLQVSKYQKFKEEVADYQSRLKDLESLLNSHIFWTQFFSLLAAHTIPQVYYQNIAAQAGGNVTLSAVAKDYESLARQLVAFQQADDLVEKVRIDSATAQPGEAGAVGGVNFSVNLTLKSGIFLKYATEQK